MSGTRFVPLRSALLAMVAALSAATLWLALERPEVVVLFASITTRSFDGAVVVLALLGAAGWVDAFVLASPLGHPLRRPLRTVAIAGWTSLTLAVGATAWHHLGAYGRTTVRFASDDGLSLGGTLYVPRTARPQPTLLLLPGSATLPRQSMELYADRLARLGVAVFIADKRGIGLSAGNVRDVAENTTLERVLSVQTADARAALRMLRARPEVDSTRIGLFAISQGGWVASRLLDRASGLVAFAIMMSAPSVSSAEEALFSDLAGERADHFGYRPPDLPFATINARLDSAGRGGFDPEPLWRATTLPVLWVYGSWDKSIPAARSAARVSEWRAAWRRDFEVQLVAEANHGLMITRGPRKRLLAYFAPEFWPIVERWLRLQTTTPPRSSRLTAACPLQGRASPVPAAV